MRRRQSRCRLVPSMCTLLRAGLFTNSQFYLLSYIIPIMYECELSFIYSMIPTAVCPVCHFIELTAVGMNPELRVQCILSHCL